MAPANNATVSGASVTVSATAADNVGVVGVQFRLDGANLGAEDTTNAYSVAWDTTTATDGAHTLTAVARDAAGNQTTSPTVTVTVANVTPGFTLTVTKAGSGNGTVTSSPTGINCSSDCTEDYVSGTSVTLTANPSGDSTLKAWSGACTGTGTCTVTMSAVRSVTATFSKTFTDDPLTANVTFVKASHFLEALEAINTLGQRNGLGNISFDAPIPAAGVPIAAKDIITLQTGINAVYDALARTRPTFDAIVAGVTVIGKRQMDQVRSVIRAVESLPSN